MTGMGRVAKTRSVNILMLLLKSPIEVNTCGLKHMALGSLARSQEARMGMHENKIVCNKVSL